MFVRGTPPALQLFVPQRETNIAVFHRRPIFTSGSQSMPGEGISSDTSQIEPAKNLLAKEIPTKRPFFDEESLFAFGGPCDDTRRCLQIPPGPRPDAVFPTFHRKVWNKCSARRRLRHGEMLSPHT
jgi:hypothetical protein